MVRWSSLCHLITLVIREISFLCAPGTLRRPVRPPEADSLPLGIMEAAARSHRSCRRGAPGGHRPARADALLVVGQAPLDALADRLQVALSSGYEDENRLGRQEMQVVLDRDRVIALEVRG